MAVPSRETSGARAVSRSRGESGVETRTLTTRATSTPARRIGTISQGSGIRRFKNGPEPGFTTARPAVASSTRSPLDQTRGAFSTIFSRPTESPPTLVQTVYCFVGFQYGRKGLNRLSGDHDKACSKNTTAGAITAGLRADRCGRRGRPSAPAARPPCRESWGPARPLHPAIRDGPSAPRARGSRSARPPAG